MHAIASERGWTPRSALVNRAVTLLIVVSAFVIFRAPDIETALDVLRALVGIGAAGPFDVPWLFAAGVFALVVFVQVAPTTWAFRERVGVTRRSAIALGISLAVGIVCIRSDSPFLYFQF